jgi:hypothetical protein
MELPHPNCPPFTFLPSKVDLGHEEVDWSALKYKTKHLLTEALLTLGTKYRTESTETEIFGTLFGSQFSGTEFNEVYSVLYLGLPNLPKCVDCECCYVNDCTIVDYYIM